MEGYKTKLYQTEKKNRKLGKFTKNKLEKLNNDHSKETQRCEEQIHFKNEFGLGYGEH